MHVMLTGEALRPPQPDAKPSLGGWFTLNWFFFPHLDLRAAAILSRAAAGGSRSGAGGGPTPRSSARTRRRSTPRTLATTCSR